MCDERVFLIDTIFIRRPPGGRAVPSFDDHDDDDDDNRRVCINATLR